MAILHVVPQHDSEPHDVDVSGECWCAPTVQDEGQTHDGYDSRTIIHQPKDRAKPFKLLGLTKVWLKAEDGSVMKLDAEPSKQLFARRQMPYPRRGEAR